MLLQGWQEGESYLPGKQSRCKGDKTVILFGDETYITQKFLRLECLLGRNTQDENLCPSIYKLHIVESGERKFALTATIWRRGMVRKALERDYNYYLLMLNSNVT